MTKGQPFSLRLAEEVAGAVDDNRRPISDVAVLYPFIEVVKP